MKDTITTNINVQLKVIPLCKGVTIEKIIEDKDNLIIEFEFSTEFEYILNYCYIINKVNGNCIVAINKDLLIKNNYGPMDKKFIEFQIKEDLSITTKSVIMDRLTYFKCEFM